MSFVVDMNLTRFLACDPLKNQVENDCEREHELRQRHCDDQENACIKKGKLHLSRCDFCASIDFIRKVSLWARLCAYLCCDVELCLEMSIFRNATQSGCQIPQKLSLCLRERPRRRQRRLRRRAEKELSCCRETATIFNHQSNC